MRLVRAGLALAALAAFLVPAFAADSGPKVGWSVQKFEVQDVTGPHKGKTLCYV